MIIRGKVSDSMGQDAAERMRGHGWACSLSPNKGRDRYPWDVRHPQGTVFHWGNRSLWNMAEYLDQRAVTQGGDLQ